MSALLVGYIYAFPVKPMQRSSVDVKDSCLNLFDCSLGCDHFEFGASSDEEVKTSLRVCLTYDVQCALVKEEQVASCSVVDIDSSPINTEDAC
ncbi:unnamed protein product [Dibothriocephalus latus]|uniref:Uncharacterized protein n=1 Tax=Dibothriocephalus latus TaxID=60516 RepID=A0A3P6PZR1_DIBLA|nr:unnamed protein product [Dibothriocephalus latus]